MTNTLASIRCHIYTTPGLLPDASAAKPTLVLAALVSALALYALAAWIAASGAEEVALHGNEPLLNSTDALAGNAPRACKDATHNTRRQRIVAQTLTYDTRRATFHHPSSQAARGRLGERRRHGGARFLSLLNIMLTLT